MMESLAVDWERGAGDVSTLLTTQRPISEDTIISDGDKNVKLK